MKKFVILRSTAICWLLLIWTCMVHAQKLPGVQTTSVSAPKDIKIDGKPVEWPKFEAYNNAIECYYTISNDAKNLYLAVQATHYGIIAKIAAGGITFTMGSTDKKSTVAPVTITYPLISPLYSQGVSYTLRTNKTLSDSLLSALNAQLSGHVKEIPLTGVKAVSDSVVSIYNTLGIKAYGLLDHQKTYTCEMAIPLQYIEQVCDATGSFRYQIQLNGLGNGGKNGIIIVGGQSLDPSEAPVSHDSANFLTSPTYLQGNYKLVKSIFTLSGRQ